MATDSLALSIVTVVHAPDVRALLLQGRSIDRFLCQSPLEILVIDNEPGGLPRASVEQIVQAYGKLADKVRLVPATDLLLSKRRATGWVTQQILKLLINSEVASPHYILFDAKNHLVAELNVAQLFARNRPRSYYTDYRTHPLRQAFEATSRFFGLDPAPRLTQSLPCVTPFVVPTWLAKCVVDAVAAISRTSFEAAFLARPYEFTEFFLIGAFLDAWQGGIHQVFDMSGRRWPTIWASSPSTAVQMAITECRDGGSPFLAVHRRAFSALSPATSNALAGFWYERGLFDSHEEAARYITLSSAKDGGGKFE